MDFGVEKFNENLVKSATMEYSFNGYSSNGYCKKGKSFKKTKKKKLPCMMYQDRNLSINLD